MLPNYSAKPAADAAAFFWCQAKNWALGVSMEGDKKVKGPASYFPSIEKTYGKPVSHWFKILDSLADQKHMAQVSHLKSEYKIGHGHANALVAYHRAQTAV